MPIKPVFSAFAAALALSVAPMALARPAEPVQAADKPASDAPRLVVAIAVDQFSADLFAQYRQHFTGGLARLMQGAVFSSAYQSHAATETCPGHSTLLTGVHPARSGIIANAWYDVTLNREEKRVYCAEDETDPNSSSKYPVVSASHLRVPTLGDRMKKAWPTSRNVAVSGKDRAVVMMGGHKIDQAYWWLEQGFTSFNGVALAPDAMTVNQQVLTTITAGAPPMNGPSWCLSRDRAVQVGTTPVGTGRFALKADQPKSFKYSPRLDGATLDLALRLIDTMKLGKQSTPDLLSVSLSATDYVGHAFGNEGMEMCIQMAELDRSLGNFFDKLDAQGLDYVVMLTADHGGIDVPERLDQQAMPDGARADAALTDLELGQAIATELKLTQFIRQDPAQSRNPGEAQLIYSESPSGDYYVTRDLPPETRAEVIDRLVSKLKAHPQVQAVYRKDELARIPMPSGSPQDWTLEQRARASFDPERTGDVYTILHRAIVSIPVPDPYYVTTHGSPWDYDRRVPLMFWRKGMPGLEQPAPVDTVDIAPTLVAVLGLNVPAGSFDGRCLDIDGSERDTCAPRP
ncbi:alkaline phosphatase [Croceicoccus estronivorus]|uniref:alkaline phosphatase family protein n=1 Tax=Croceicoccus estronivorus TaxID=1172626 RepID=UPI000833089F|nr:alkaline phosphatase family protein [Croceicoccus estronivorus]OCC23422.1 alkaline phosphatase [Croceicoccus estronivorus]